MRIGLPPKPPTLPVTLLVPKLWTKLFTGFKDYCSSNRLNLTLKYPPESELGSLTMAKVNEIKTIDQKMVKIRILPLGQYLLGEVHPLNHLTILGPAVKTVNDVLIFRNLNRRDEEPNPTLGVRGDYLTTTCIAKVIWQRWSPQCYFGRVDKPKWEGRQLSTLSWDRWDDRLSELEGKNIGAALFTGSEITSVRSKQRSNSNLVEVANLNRIISNYYDVRYFPRAVLVGSPELFNNEPKYEGHRDTLSVFLRLYTEKAKEAESQQRSRNPAGEESDQRLCRTGILASLAEVRVMFEFGQHLLECYVGRKPTWTLKKFGFFDTMHEQLIAQARAVAKGLREFDRAKLKGTSDSDEGITKMLESAAGAIEIFADSDPAKVTLPALRDKVVQNLFPGAKTEPKYISVDEIWKRTILESLEGLWVKSYLGGTSRGRE